MRNVVELDPAKALAAQQAGELVLVDVREDDERAQAHVPGSWHIPLAELPARLTNLPGDKVVALICRSGGRSSVAAAGVARQRRKVADVRGGMLAWERAGLSVARGVTIDSNEEEKT